MIAHISLLQFALNIFLNRIFIFVQIVINTNSQLADAASYEHLS